jgi:hypothetical protein
VKPRRLIKESHPLEQLDEVIEEIKRIMLRSVTKYSRKEKLSRRKPAIATGKQQQHQQGDGADGQLQRTIWDPGGFKQ